MHKINNSQRLSFSLMNENDEPLLWELDQDPLVMKYINGGIPSSKTDITTIFIPRLKSYTNSAKGWGLWKVTTLHNDAFIGWILVRPMHFFSDEKQLDNLELGWRFKQSTWGKGYGTEASLAVKNSFIENTYEHPINQFSAIALANNTASINLMKKLGMKYQKTAVHQDPLGDEEVEFYSLYL